MLMVERDMIPDDEIGLYGPLLSEQIHPDGFNQCMFENHKSGWLAINRCPFSSPEVVSGHRIKCGRGVYFLRSFSLCAMFYSIRLKRT